MVWPASMLAKRRTERLMGRVKKEITSIGTSREQDVAAPAGTNSLRKPMPCLMKPVTITSQDHQAGQREGDGDLAGDGEAARHHAEEVAAQHEHEEREDEGEEFQPVLAGGRMDHVGDEFVGQFRHGLAAGRAPAGSA